MDATHGLAAILRDAAPTGAAPEAEFHDIFTTSHDQLEIFHGMPAMTEPDVLIVGAGPVGLTLAIDLAWRGIDVRVVEPRARAAPPDPKCNHVAARTMEIFRRLGLSEKVRKAGLPA